MAKFIELHEKGFPIMVNLDHVTRVFYSAGGMAVVVSDSGEMKRCPDESYEQVRKLIATAQGGIPMQPSEMY